MTFEDLKLLPGIRLQLQFHSVPSIRENSRLIGYHKKESIILATPLINGSARPIKVGESLNIRLFSNQANAAAAFSCKVKHISLLPFPHFHVQYPADLVTDEVRKSTRVDLTLMASAQTDSTIETVTVVNLSTTGCRLHSNNSLGHIGGTLKLTLKLAVAGEERSITISAQIMAELEKANTKGPAITYGLSFEDLTDKQSLVLHAYVYYMLN
ncbi:MAG: hypothetical protein COC19_04905 [SAR86 cluster bacterium]|uniref:Flagellar brake protein n=1 Tax=SAR86 cluster bacterium TaxID=2030880 RepID=A0A2A4MMN3_9GAMM|nr:MAG: hypothetical protein COC19_04905 [SAR86 cluster bacterium]